MVQLPNGVPYGTFREGYMTQTSFFRVVLLCSFTIASGVLGAPLAGTKPIVSMFPPANADGRSFRELFTDPDGWTKTRSQIDALGYADHWLDKQFSDNELRPWFAQMDQWNLKLQLEVGAIKEWGPTGGRAFAADRKHWDRFRALGARIETIAMDEPLVAARKALHQSPEYAVEETAKFIALVRQNYPDLRTGDIETYPSTQTKELMAFVDALQDRLKQMNVRGLDFFRLDVDWMHFKPGDPLGREGWRGVRAVELGCRERGIPFSLIYWAANYPSLKQQGRATDEDWNTSVLRQGREYAAVGGSPDEYVIESWVGAPAHAVPETAPGTFTRSVLDFTRHYVKAR
jgi:hypothetical protein